LNMRLSQDRASSVASYLTNQGVSAARISSRGVGPSQPIASNNTPEGRAQNRRAETNPRPLRCLVDVSNKNGACGPRSCSCGPACGMQRSCARPMGDLAGEPGRDEHQLVQRDRPVTTFPADTPDAALPAGHPSPPTAS